MTAAPDLGGAVMAASDSLSKPPHWLQSLLLMAAEKLALSGAITCTFSAWTGSTEDETFTASLRFDPVSTLVALYVHHTHTGRFACRSQSAIVDLIDPGACETDHSNPLANPGRVDRMSIMQPATIAGVYTLPADPAAALDAILNDRDRFSYYWQDKEARLTHELLMLPGAEKARQLRWQMSGGIEAEDVETADALRLLQAWVRKLGIGKTRCYRIKSSILDDIGEG